MFNFSQAWSDMNFQKTVYWAEKETDSFSLSACHISLGDQLNELFREPQVWTSATLGYWHKDQYPSTKDEANSEGLSF